MSKTIYEPKIKKDLLSKSMLNIETNTKILDDIPEKDEEISEEKKKMIDEEIKKEEIKPKNSKIDLEALSKVFGETFNQKGKNIKNKSLFGNSNFSYVNCGNHYNKLRKLRLNHESIYVKNNLPLN